ncbi:MAG: RNA polymerase factor sigma-54 [Planctomycetota bacterium]
MRFETGQHLQISQRMKLAPRAIQSMEILQLPSLALEERISQELERNVALETDEPNLDNFDLNEFRREQAEEARIERKELTSDPDSREDFERLDAMESSYREAFENEFDTGSSNNGSRDGDYPNRNGNDDWQYRRTRSSDGEGDAKLEAMANTAARAESLTEQLQHQWMLAEVEPQIRTAGGHLINYIDDDGYLRTDLQTIADQAPPGVSSDDLRMSLPAVQTWLEPNGIGARNLQECLLLQIAAIEEETGESWAIEEQLVRDHLNEIEQNRLPKITRSLRISMDELKAAMNRLRTLDPRPGRRLSPDDPQVIVPDAIIEYDEATDTYIPALFDGRLPRLRISPAYSAMAKDAGLDRNTRQFIDSNVRDARWLIEAIDQRSNTLLRVLRHVLAHQRDFFDLGPQALRPLPMTQVAEQMGVHVATVSRAVSGKWVQTPRGVLPLRKFFTAGTETDEGAEISWDAVKQTLREIIDEEDKHKPMGDDALSEALAERGVKIARRTVAKYRDELGIPPARLRKEF